MHYTRYALLYGARSIICSMYEHHWERAYVNVVDEQCSLLKKGEESAQKSESSTSDFHGEELVDGMQ